tara:strand:+ start:2462 stop:2704 length:243 start_codon:yes stop_codon:yes gene_type:complete
LHSILINEDGMFAGQKKNAVELLWYKQRLYSFPVALTYAAVVKETKTLNRCFEGLPAFDLAIKLYPILSDFGFIRTALSE